jgi:hypothetical protein
MGQAYNYISFLGNEDLGIMLREIEYRFNVFRAKNPNGFSEESIGFVFYGLNPTEFSAATDISEVTKYLRISYFSPSESEFLSGSSIPTDFQDYLTVSLAKVDPYVIIINDFNTTHNEYGCYTSLCQDAVNGNFQIISEYYSLEDSDGSGRGLRSLRKKLVREIHKQAPWSKKALSA